MPSVLSKLFVSFSTSGASVIWLENLTTGKLEWKRVCNESFTSVVLYPYHVLMLKKQVRRLRC